MKKILLALIAIDICLSFSNHINIKKIMAKQETFDALIVRLNAATNDIAADLQKLRDEIAAGGTDTISDESLAKLDANIAALEAIGADPVDPVPVDPPADPNA